MNQLKSPCLFLLEIKENEDSRDYLSLSTNNNLPGSNPLAKTQNEARALFQRQRALSENLFAAEPVRPIWPLTKSSQADGGSGLPLSHWAGLDWAQSRDDVWTRYGFSPISVR